MDPIHTRLLFESSVTAIVLADGLDAGLGDVLQLVRRPAQLARAVVAVLVVTPLAAVVAVELLPLSLPAKAGVILMALAPIPSVLPKTALIAGGRKAYVFGLYATFSALAVLTVPLTVAALNRRFGTSVAVPMDELVRLVLGSVLAPLAVGMLVRAIRPRLAERVAPWISALSLILLTAAAALILMRNWPVIMSTIGDGIALGIAAISVVALLGGHLMGGPDPRDRSALAATAATRHPAIAMAVAHANSADKRIDAAIIIYLIVSVVVVTIYQAALIRAARRAPSRR